MRFAAHSRGRGETVDVGGQQLGVEAPVDPVEAPGLGVLHLVGPDEQPVLLLAVVAGRARVAYHRRLPVEAADLVEVLGHEVLVDHVDDGAPPSPTQRATCGAKEPVAFTTCSHTMLPLSVTTSHSPPGKRRVSVTRVWR